MSLIYTANFNPIALEIGPLAIRWYSLSYIAGVLFALFFLTNYSKKTKIMSEKALDDWLFWAVLSIIIGGRVGYVLFYNPVFFLQNPLEIPAIWHGGMSFHGGLCGAIFGMWLFSKKYQIEFWRLMDILAIITPIGLFFGRVANFINMELYGRPTNADFGVIFTNVDNLPRHPSQLYEAMLEGLLLFLILFIISKLTKLQEKPKFLSALFLIGYGSARIVVENFREPDEQIGFLFSQITMGQILSMPFIVAGILLIFSTATKTAKNTAQK